MHTSACFRLMCTYWPVHVSRWSKLMPSLQKSELPIERNLQIYFCIQSIILIFIANTSGVQSMDAAHPLNFMWRIFFVVALFYFILLTWIWYTLTKCDHCARTYAQEWRRFRFGICFFCTCALQCGLKLEILSSMHFGCYSFVYISIGYLLGRCSLMKKKMVMVRADDVLFRGLIVSHLRPTVSHRLSNWCSMRSQSGQQERSLLSP